MKNLPFEVCFNRHSIYDGTHEEAIQMFMSSLKGLVSVYNEYHIDCETAFIYYDCEKPFSDCNICLDFSLGDIISKIEDLNPDLIDFFMNISTQAPFEKKIQSNFYESIACTGFVAECIGGEDAKNFHFALLTDAYILSMPCKPWHRSFIKCHGYCNGKRITSDEPFYIKIFVVKVLIFYMKNLVHTNVLYIKTVNYMFATKTIHRHTFMSYIKTGVRWSSSTDLENI